MNNARARGLLSAGLASKLILIRIHFEIFLNLLQINWKSWSLIAARSETRVDVHDINIKILLTRVEIRACQRKTTTATATAVLYSSRSIHSFIHASNFSAKRKYVSIGKSILRICARSPLNQRLRDLPAVPKSMPNLYISIHQNQSQL